MLVMKLFSIKTISASKRQPESLSIQFDYFYYYKLLFLNLFNFYTLGTTGGRHLLYTQAFFYRITRTVI